MIKIGEQNIFAKFSKGQAGVSCKPVFNDVFFSLHLFLLKGKGTEFLENGFSFMEKHGRDWQIFITKHKIIFFCILINNIFTNKNNRKSNNQKLYL